MFDANAQCRFELPGADPRTVVVYRPLTQEDALVMEGLVIEINRAEAALGREPHDPAAMRKKAKAQRSHVASRVSQIENLHQPGDVITDEEAVVAFLRDLPEGWFDGLLTTMRMGLKLFEAKA